MSVDLLEEELETGILSAPEDAEIRQILEVGGSYCPVINSRFRKVFSNERYFNFASRLCSYYNRRESIATAEKLGRASLYTFVATSGTNLHTIADESIDEFVLTSVLGDPEIYDSSRMRMLQEAFRVIKPGGKIVITEYMVPRFPKTRLIQTILEHFSDLDIEEIDDCRKIAEYANTYPEYCKDSYQLVLTKRKKQTATQSVIESGDNSVEIQASGVRSLVSKLEAIRTWLI